MTQEIFTSTLHAHDDTDETIGSIVPNWTPRAHPLSDSRSNKIYGQYCRLELLNSKTDDTIIKQLYQIFKLNEETHFKYLKYGPFQAVDEFKEFIVNKEKPASDTILYTIFVNDEALGFLGYLRINQEYGTIEIGNINFSQCLVRTRPATEATFLLIQLAFDTLGYRRVEWKCNALNVKSRRAAIRLGFQYEGAFLKAEVCKGRSRDNAWFSIVDDEWSSIKQEFQRWLNENNFDINEQQLSKLNASKVNPSRSTIINVN